MLLRKERTVARQKENFFQAINLRQLHLTEYETTLRVTPNVLQTQITPTMQTIFNLYSRQHIKWLDLLTFRNLCFGHEILTLPS